MKVALVEAICSLVGYFVSGSSPEAIAAAIVIQKEEKSLIASA